MSKTDTLVILSPGFPANEADSTCMPPQQVFVRNLKQNFPQLNIIVLAFQYPYYPSEYKWHGVTVISFGGRNMGSIFRVFNWIRVWHKIMQLNRQYNIIGLLSFWMGECAFIGSKFAKMTKLKHYCWILGQDAKPGNNYFKFIKPQASEVIALSDFIAAEFGKNYNLTPEKVIPPGIDTTMFEEQQHKERYIDILGAGSLIPLKQYHLFVNIVGILRYSFPEIQAIICGKGPEMEHLKIMIKNLDLENNVTLMGELPHDDVLKLMQRTRVFVHTSAYEGFGVVCLEALYAGAQVVSFVRSMDSAIKNWHFAYMQDDMVEVIKELLEDGNPDHNAVAPFFIRDSNIAIMKLFNYSYAAIS
ncbi:MAG: glycosyltransferase family 4 protein [Sphingobacteriales bacterium]